MSPFVLALLGMLLASPQTTCFFAPNFHFQTPDRKAHVTPAVICPLIEKAPAASTAPRKSADGVNL